MNIYSIFLVSSAYLGSMDALAAIMCFLQIWPSKLMCTTIAVQFSGSD